MFQVESGGSSTLLRVQGDVDVYCRDRFVRALNVASEGGERRLVVSLENCRLVDCSGIGVLVAARNALGARLNIVAPPHAFARRIFDLLKLTGPLNIYASIDEALAEPPRVALHAAPSAASM